MDTNKNICSILTYISRSEFSWTLAKIGCTNILSHNVNLNCSTLSYIIKNFSEKCFCLIYVRSKLICTSYLLLLSCISESILTHAYTHRLKRENQTRKRITQFAYHISFPMKMHVFFRNELNKVPAKQFGIFFFYHARASREYSSCLLAVMLLQKNVQTNWRHFFFMKFVNVDNNRNKSKMNSARKKKMKTN